MRGRLFGVWDQVRASYWFVPSLMALAAALLSEAALSLDHEISGRMVAGPDWLYSGSPEGARQVLSAIAGAIITVAGTTFSITIAALSLASSQFGPRLLRNFMNRGNQVVLGTFTSTFLYCLLVLRTIRGTEDTRFVPHVATSLGVGLAIVSVGVLIFFIHHSAQSIQVSHIIDRVGTDLDKSLRKMFPESPVQADLPAVLPTSPPIEIAADEGGYVLSIDTSAIERLTKNRGIVQLLVRPGDYVIVSQSLAHVWLCADPQIHRKIRNSIGFGLQRTSYQDVEFGFLELSEVAVRALSPGINDPFTAMMCLDRIAASMTLLSKRHPPSPYRFDFKGTLRVIAPAYSHRDLVEAGFRLIRENARDHLVVLERMQFQLRRLRDGCLLQDLRDALAKELSLVEIMLKAAG